MEIRMKDVLKRELRARNESINGLARACKIPVATLHGWLQGVLPTAKNIHYLKTLSDHLGISLSVLLFNEAESERGSSILFSSTFVDEEKRYRLVIEKLPK